MFFCYLRVFVKLGLYPLICAIEIYVGISLRRVVYAYMRVIQKVCEFENISSFSVKNNTAA